MHLPGNCEALEGGTGRSEQGYKLWLSTRNTSVGTHVLMTCSKTGLSYNGSVTLACTRDHRWNGSITDCFLNAHERHLHDTATTKDWTAEVIVIWSVGGAMVAMLAAMLAVILCIKYKCKNSRRTSPHRASDRRGEQNSGFVPVYDIEGSLASRGERVNAAAVFPPCAPPYPGSPRSIHPQPRDAHIADTSASTSHYALPPPPYPGSLPRGAATRIMTSSIVHAQPEQSATTSRDRHSVPMPLPRSAQPTSRPEILEPPPPYTRYPTERGCQQVPERRSFSGRTNRSLDSTIYI